MGWLASRDEWIGKGRLAVLIYADWSMWTLSAKDESSSDAIVSILFDFPLSLCLHLSDVQLVRPNQLQ